MMYYFRANTFPSLPQQVEPGGTGQMKTQTQYGTNLLSGLKKNSNRKVGDLLLSMNTPGRCAEIPEAALGELCLSSTASHIPPAQTRPCTQQSHRDLNFRHQKFSYKQTNWDLPVNFCFSSTTAETGIWRGPMRREGWSFPWWKMGHSLWWLFQYEERQRCVQTT